MKATLKKSLKLEKRTIRKLDVRSGLQGGRYGMKDYTVDELCVSILNDCIPVSTVYLCDGPGNGGK